MIKKTFVIFLFTFWSVTPSAQVLIALLFGKKLNTDKLEFGLMVSPSITNILNISSKYRPILVFWEDVNRFLSANCRFRILK